MKDITKFSLASLCSSLRNGDFTSQELVEAYLENIALATVLNAYTSVCADHALECAKQSDYRFRIGQSGLLEGIPLGIKDIFCTKIGYTTAASKMLQNFQSPYESFVTQRLWDAGAVMLGKLNMDEFAMGSSTENSAFGPTISPRRKKDSDAPMTPGGSSGGSSAAVAAHLCAGSVATSTGGSIRQPAAMTGTVGIKPSYGRCSRRGIISFASSLDQAGSIARTVEDAAIMADAMIGYDSMDSTSVKKDPPNCQQAVRQSVRGLRIGVPEEYRVDGMCPSVSTMWDKGVQWLKDSGCSVSKVSMPHTKYALSVYYIIAPGEASSNLAQYDGVRYGYRAKLQKDDDIEDMYCKTRSEAFGAEVRRRIIVGTYVLASGHYEEYYLKAQKVRRLIREDFDRAFESVDALLVPTTPSGAFELGKKVNDPVSMYLNDILAVTVNLAGLPAISVPCGYDENRLPLGLQVIGRPFDESTIFSVAQALEKQCEDSFEVEDMWWIPS